MNSRSTEVSPFVGFRGRNPHGYPVEDIERELTAAVQKSVSETLNGSKLIAIAPSAHGGGATNHVTVHPVTLHFNISVNIVMGDNVSGRRVEINHGAKEDGS
jgi:hypothetical protein